MKEYSIKINNCKGEFQEFIIQENDDNIKLLEYLSHDISSVEIPDFINEKPVTVIEDTCFFNHPELKRVIFPNTIERIGEEAFALCSGIEGLLLPDSITEIGVHAFRDCKGLKKVVMPKHLSVLRAGVFAFCYLHDDTVIELPNELEEIEAHAFYSGGSFKLVIPESVKRIGIGAFNWGPKVITSLPYDKGWYLDWPYGEKIILSNGQVGVVSDVKEIINGCEILEVNVNNSILNVFYPCFNDKDFRFESEIKKKTMEDSFAMNHEKELKETYQFWLDGLI